MLEMKTSAALFEVIWFVLGGLLLFIAVDDTLSNGFSSSWYYYLFSIAAFVMYALRRRMRFSNRQK
jgi:hypothetical protein